MGKLIRGVSKNARFFVVDTTDIVQEAQNIHKCSPTAIDAFGRLLTAGVIMGSTLKGNDVLTLRTDTNGFRTKRQPLGDFHRRSGCLILFRI